MKKIFIIILLINATVFSQEKKIFIFDNDTKLAVSKAQVFYKELNEGSITNDDGKTKIFLKNKDLSISHINYNNIIISKHNIKEIDTIWLTQKVHELQEINLTKIDLEKKLNYVLENYNKLYVNHSTEKECSFKETFLMDNEFKRLFLSELRWWSKNSELIYNKKHAKFIKLKLGKIKYHKSESLYLSKNEKKNNNSGAITTKSLINFFYLNHAIKSLLLPKIGQIESTIDNIDEETTTISYTTEWKLDSKGVSNRNVGLIMFDNKTNAIKKFIKNIEYKNRISKTTNKETNISKIVEYKNNSFEYDFVKDNNDFWSLKHFNTSIEVLLTYDDKQHKLNLSNTLYVMKETKMKKVNNDGLMDLDKPIYKNLPSKTIPNINSILLTEKEKKFIHDSN